MDNECKSVDTIKDECTFDKESVDGISNASAFTCDNLELLLPDLFNNTLSFLSEKDVALLNRTSNGIYKMTQRR